MRGWPKYKNRYPSNITVDILIRCWFAGGCFAALALILLGNGDWVSKVGIGILVVWALSLAVAGMFFSD